MYQLVTYVCKESVYELLDKQPFRFSFVFVIIEWLKELFQF